MLDPLITHLEKDSFFLEINKIGDKRRQLATNFENMAPQADRISKIFGIIIKTPSFIPFSRKLP